MSEQAKKDYDWATDTEPFFVFLGIYVAAFQSMEGVLDEIILLEAGFENREASFIRLAGLSHKARIDAVAAASVNVERFKGMVRDDAWTARSTELIGRLHAERSRRNSLLHSKFWLRGLEAGINAIRTDNKRMGGKLVQHVEEMSRERMDAVLKELAILSFDVGMLHMQLIHWHR